MKHRSPIEGRADKPSRVAWNQPTIHRRHETARFDLVGIDFTGPLLRHQSGGSA
jgi:hypothetical protein